MSVRHLLAARAATHLSVAAGGYEIGSGRTVPTVAAVLGLISVVAAGWLWPAPPVASSATGEPGASWLSCWG